MATFWPSTKPASLRPARKAANRWATDSADEGLRNPTTGIAGCCARAESGHTIAAPPRSVINARRLIVIFRNSGGHISEAGNMAQQTIVATCEPKQVNIH